MDGVTEGILREASPEDLVSLHNSIPGVRQVSRLGDPSTARARLRLALERAGLKLARARPRETGRYRTVPESAINQSGGSIVRQKRIRLLVTENPKRPGSKCHARYLLYRDGMTLGEYIEAVEALGRTSWSAWMDIYCDRDRGFIEIQE